jgi:phage shock protein A
MLKNFIAIVKSWFSSHPEPEQIALERAQKEMEALHNAYRERAVKAITEKNELQNKINVAEFQIKRINEKLERAKERGNTEEDFYAILMQEKDEYEKEIVEMYPRLQVATALCEEIKKEIRDKESDIRERVVRSFHPKRK